MVILIADDEAGIRNSLNLVLKKDNEIIQCEDGAAALAELERTAVDVVITDFSMPKVTGIELIRLGKEVSPTTAFLLMTAHGSVEQAVEAIRLGADDYFMKPFDITEIEHRIQRIRDLRSWRMEKAVQRESGKAVNSLIGQSPAMARAHEFIVKVGDVPSPILISGPTGCEHEVLAQAIHEAGLRASYPFIMVNCASLEERLLEADLFGQEKEASGGIGKSGKFELAREGTLFFDEIADLPILLQAKLPRVLKEREFFRVGGTRRTRTEARVIAATRYNLKDLVKAGKFREDLYLQLNVLNFELPPLAARPEDIPLMVRHFLLKMTKELKRNLSLSSEALAALTAYAYPGNVRELQNVVERLVVVGSPTGTIGLDALPAEFRTEEQSGDDGSTRRATSGPIRISLGETPLQEMVEGFERKLITLAMEQSNHNDAKAAALLKIGRGALKQRIKALKLFGLMMDENEDSGQDAA